MIKKLQHKITITTLIITTIIIFLSLFGINFYVNKKDQRECSSKLSRAKELMFSSTQQIKGQYGRQFPQNVTLLDEGSNPDLWENIINERSDSGTISGYHYLRFPSSKGITILTTSSNDMLFSTLKKTSILVGFVVWFFIFVMMLFISPWLTKPIEESIRMQKQFILDASHEIKTPIAAIRANGDILHDSIGENKWLENIQTEAKRMSELQEEMFQLAMLESQKNEEESSSFDISKVIEREALSFESLCFEQGITYDISCESNIPVHTKKHAVCQIERILLENALKYVKEKGHIQVKSWKDKNKACFSVYNSGEGIQEKEKEKIFTRFYRGDISRSRKSGGAGLGLSIATQLVKSMQGDISVESKEGEWICFTVTLPR